MYSHFDSSKNNRNNLFYIINRSDFTQWQIYANYPELHYEAFSKTLKKAIRLTLDRTLDHFQ